MENTPRLESIHGTLQCEIGSLATRYMHNCVLIIQLAILLVHTNSRLDHTTRPCQMFPEKNVCSLEDKLATYE